MKQARLVWIVISILIFVAPIHAFSADETAINEVLVADKARGAAMLAADTNALAMLLADDLKYTHSTGLLETKATHIQSYVKGLRYARFETSNVVGHLVTPEVVVLNGIIDQRKGVAEKWTDYHLLFHSVWRKKGDAWQMVSMQTAAPPIAAK